MYRKALQTLAVTLVISLLVVVSELTVLASVRAPARPLLAATGASPQAPAEQVRPEALAPAADGPSRLVTCHAAAEWAGPAGAAFASPVSAPKITLGQLTTLEGTLARGTYADRTTPTGFESALGGVTPLTVGQAPTLLLALVMLAAIVLVAAPTDPAAQEAAAAAVRAPRVQRSTTGQQRLQRPWFVPRALAYVDRAADWERVRLVPT